MAKIEVVPLHSPLVPLSPSECGPSPQTTGYAGTPSSQRPHEVLMVRQRPVEFDAVKGRDVAITPSDVWSKEIASLSGRRFENCRDAIEAVARHVVARFPSDRNLGEDGMRRELQFVMQLLENDPRCRILISEHLVKAHK